MLRRLIVIFFLGFSSGLPYALVGSTLQAWYSVSGIDITTIGMLSLIGQPYIYKFIWAPLLDRYTVKWLTCYLDRRRSWILIMQMIMIVLLLCLSQFNPVQHSLAIAAVALVTAFIAASQDIVIDAYRTDLLKPEERGIGSALAVSGYRVGMLLSGGLALAFAQYYSWQLTYQLMSGLMLIGVIANLLAPKVASVTILSRSLSQTLIAPFNEFIQRRYGWYFLSLIFLYSFASVFTSSSGGVSTPFLLRGMGFTLATVGFVNKIGGIVALLIGSFAAGFVMLRLSLYRALLSFGIAQVISNILFWILALTGPSLVLLTIAVTVDNLCIGMGLTALVALIMALCKHEFSATQFALLSAIAAAPRILSGPIAGLMVPHCGWVIFYGVAVLLAIPSLLLLYGLRKPIVQLNGEA